MAFSHCLAGYLFGDIALKLTQINLMFKLAGVKQLTLR